MTGGKKWRIGLYYIAILAAVMAGIIALSITAVMVFKHFGVIGEDESGYSIALVTAIITSILLTFLAALMLGKNIITPVSKLSVLTSRVAKGDFNATLDAKSFIDEIQTVIDSFNAMVRELGNNEELSCDFITNVSHEFKTPIAAIEGYATLLEDQAVSGAEKAEYVEKILINTARLSELTGNILLLSKLETQNIVSDKAFFALDEQIRHSILALENRWGKKDITFNVDLDETYYFGSEGLLATVWTNIIGNAVKYSENGSEIGVALKKTEDSVAVTVTDNGIGILPEELPRIFDKFYQCDLSHRSEGNGLGLTMVKRILDLCGGRANVKSSPGAGTEFTITLLVEKGEKPA